VAKVRMVKTKRKCRRAGESVKAQARDYVPR
jgi:hypothetical protein